jgi:hypothetical protein
MTRPTYVQKAKIVAMLRSRGLQARADWVDRELPEDVDLYKNSALLQMLGFEPEVMAPVDAAPPGC